MPKFMIATRAEVERVYEVDAADAKAALDASVNLAPISETDVSEETLEIKQVP